MIGVIVMYQRAELKPIMDAIRFFAAITFVLAVTACGGGYEGVPQAPIDNSTLPLAVVGPTSVTVVPSEMKRIEINGGRRPYSVNNPNSSVALASVSDNILSVAGIKGQLAPLAVLVTDAAGTKVSLSVSVTNSPEQGSFSLAPRELAVTPGATAAISIAGGTPPYTAISGSPLVLIASVSGSVVTVTGVAEGVGAEIKVIDSKGVTQTAVVTVAAMSSSGSGLALFTNIPASLNLPPKNSRTYTIGGGQGPYVVTTSNAAVVSATVRGSAVTLQTAASGTATVVITDGLGQQMLRTVVVRPSASPLILGSTAISGVVGTSTRVGIAGGTPPYRVSTSTTSVGSASIVSDDSLSITFAQVGGPGTISVVDSENNSASIAVTGIAVLSNLSVSPARITISERQPQLTMVPILVVNAVQPLRVFTSHPYSLIPTVNGNVVEVRTPGTTAAPISPCVDGDTQVYITVIDGTGASAATIITIADNGDCPI